MIHNPLTPRQRQVLQLIAEGNTDKGVATALGVSVACASVHLDNIRLALGVHGRVNIVIYAIRHGLVTLPGIAAIEVTD